MPQSVVKKIALPIDLCCSCCDSFGIANQIRKNGVAGNANQYVEMIGHQEK